MDFLRRAELADSAILVLLDFLGQPGAGKPTIAFGGALGEQSTSANAAVLRVRGM